MLKAFHAYRIKPEAYALFSEPALNQMVSNRPAVDPTAGQWRKLGWGNHPAFNDNGIFIGAGGARAMMAEIRERVLPSNVIQGSLGERIADLAERQGHTVNRKQAAELKELVVADLLGKAFVKTTTVLVLIHADLLLVGTSSPKVADDVIGLLRESTDKVLSLSFLQGHKFTGTWLTNLARDLETDHSYFDDQMDEIEYEGVFSTGRSALLVNVEKSGGKVRFSDRSMSDELVVPYLEDPIWRVKELAVQWGEDLSFVVNDAGVFKRLKFSDLRLEETKADAGEDADMYAMFDASLYLLTTYVGRMLSDIEHQWAAIERAHKPAEKPSASDRPAILGDRDIGTSNLEEVENEEDDL